MTTKKAAPGGAAPSKRRRADPPLVRTSDKHRRDIAEYFVRSLEADPVVQAMTAETPTAEQQRWLDHARGVGRISERLARSARSAKGGAATAKFTDPEVQREVAKRRASGMTWQQIANASKDTAWQIDRATARKAFMAFEAKETR